MAAFVPAKSKNGRRLIRIGKDVNPVPDDVKAWNERVEREKQEKRLAPFLPEPNFKEKK